MVSVAVETVCAGESGAVGRVGEIGVGQFLRIFPDGVGDQRPDARRIRFAAAHQPGFRQVAAHEAEPAGGNHFGELIDMHGVRLL
ncbi:hypothetical protein SDC9_184881 [bioreactor metagenome]|uniref:Uncharacterized protein n=1 Tax=bioreactor metagenome TaxID=1076179 RepID=A0A645HMM4_9ZZZZ